MERLLVLDRHRGETFRLNRRFSLARGIRFAGERDPNAAVNRYRGYGNGVKNGLLWQILLRPASQEIGRQATGRRHAESDRCWPGYRCAFKGRQELGGHRTEPRGGEKEIRHLSFETVIRQAGRAIEGGASRRHGAGFRDGLPKREDRSPRPTDRIGRGQSRRIADR